MPRHAIEARLNTNKCLTCHQEKRCIECHQKNKLTGNGASNSKHNPHGPNWMKKGAARNHGREARRDPFSCAACHDQGAASNCVACHRVGGSGGDPHPPGWRSDLDKRTAVACVPCHIR